MNRLNKLAPLAVLFGSAVFLLDSPASAQQAAKPPSAVTTPPASVPAPQTPAAPETTTATFGDWILRCDRRLDVKPPQRFCELSQIVQRPGETAAQGQLAVGRVSRGEPLKITVVLPPNVAFKTLPKLVADGNEPVSVELGWTRCVVGACFADVTASDELLKKLRSRTEPGRIEYRDGTDRDATLPISFRGLGPALDALGREPEN